MMILRIMYKCEVLIIIVDYRQFVYCIYMYIETCVHNIMLIKSNLNLGEIITLCFVH